MTGFTETGFTTSGFVADGGGLALIKNVAAETVQLSEAINRVKGTVKLPNAETVQLSESVNRVIAAGGQVFTSLAISETVNKLVTETTDQFLVASQLHLRFSGGASYNGNLDGGIGSLGGALSSTEVTNNTLGSSWDDVTFSQSGSGVTEYRCFYIYNAHATLTAYNVNIWIDTTTPAGDSIEVAKGSAGMSSTEPTVGSETTAPSGTLVSFSSAPNEDSAINLGDIPATGYRSIWLKRIVPAGTPGWNDNSYVVRVSFVSDHL